MSVSMIVDEEEVRRWLADGRTYQFMADAYERQYALQVPASVFGEYRREHGLIHTRPSHWLELAGIEF